MRRTHLQIGVLRQKDRGAELIEHLLNVLSSLHDVVLVQTGPDHDADHQCEYQKASHCDVDVQSAIERSKDADHDQAEEQHGHREQNAPHPVEGGDLRLRDALDQRLSRCFDVRVSYYVLTELRVKGREVVLVS